jgi:N-sulfoglucosamine sulfohydrolase
LRRRDVLKAAAATPLLYACLFDTRRPRDEGRPRDILLIVSDDQSRCDLGCYGNPACTTPNLDRLAAEGRRFHCAYTPVSLCLPARASLYTGLYPHKHGATGFVAVREGVKTWPTWLAGGLATGMVGKLNVLPPEQFPFEFLSRSGPLNKAGRSPARFEELFAEFLEDVGERRFAAVVNLRDPHRPFEEDRFQGELTLPPARHAPEDAWVPPSLWDTPETRAELADYYGALERLDETAGRILRLLEGSGRAREALVVFTSDNGMPFPFAKSTLYEAGINLPFLVRWPGVVEPGSECDAFVSLVDLLPTALDVAGMPPGELDGRSLLPLLRGELGAVREQVVGAIDELLAQEPTPLRSIRERRYKYIRNFRPEVEFANNVLEHSATWASWEAAARDEPELSRRMQLLRRRPSEELYDLELDPWELENLADRPERAADKARLRAALREWMQREGDPELARWSE